MVIKIITIRKHYEKDIVIKYVHSTLYIHKRIFIIVKLKVCIFII